MLFCSGVPVISTQCAASGRRWPRGLRRPVGVGDGGGLGPPSAQKALRALKVLLSLFLSRCACGGGGGGR